MTPNDELIRLGGSNDSLGFNILSLDRLAHSAVEGRLSITISAMLPSYPDEFVIQVDEPAMADFNDFERVLLAP